MEINYHSIRKSNKPLTISEARKCYAKIDSIDCGYVELITKYGPGTIANGINIIHPSKIIATTNEVKYYIGENAKRPVQLPKEWINDVVILGGMGRTHYMFHPKVKGCLLIYDGDSDKIYLNKHGFNDPRFGIHKSEVYYGRDYDLIFDSHCNCENANAFCGDKNPVSTMDLLYYIHEHLFTPGDIIKGDLQNEGNSIIYLSKIGGYIKVNNETIHAYINEVSISHDKSERERITKLLSIFKKKGYKISRFKE